MFRRADELTTGPLTLARPAGVRRWRVPAPHLWALLLVTVFGGALRFYRLADPPLWNDETLVFWRVCGTYGQMLVPLHTDGFPPLHYTLYWLLGHPVPVGSDAIRPVLGWLVATGVTAAAGGVAAFGVRRRVGWVRWLFPLQVAAVVGAVLCRVLVGHGGGGVLWPAAWVPDVRTLKLTPWVMRSVPAVAGTLTIPAMYFLARQLLPRGASLVAAGVTACSAFMLFYSRDAKMYPDAWLLVTVNVACLLWWFRTGRGTAYLGWIAAGCGMVGLHASALVVPGVSILYLFTQRRADWRTGVLFGAGLVVILAGPVGYYTKFNVWTERVEEYGWATSGLGWVGGFFNGDRDGPEHALYTASAFLAGFEWPRDDYLKHVVPVLVEGPQTVFLELAAVLAVAALPWPLVRAIARPRRQGARDAAAPEPAWRVWLWLGAWVLVPGYAFYCRSVVGFVSPRRWVYEVDRAVHPAAWAPVLGGVVTLGVAATTYRPMRAMVARLASFWLATAVLYGLCLGVFLASYPMAMDAAFGGRPWESVWTPRYLGFMWPAVGVGVAAMLMRLPTRAVRAAAVAFFCLANLGMASLRLALSTEPPIEQLADDIWAGQGAGAGATRTYDNITNGGIEVAGTNLGVNTPKVAGGRYFLAMQSGFPLSPGLFETSLSPSAPHPYALHENVPYAQFRREVAASPGLERVIVWTQLFAGQPVTFDTYRLYLPPGWRLAHEAVYPVRVVWDWREKWRWVRREYVRRAAATR